MFRKWKVPLILFLLLLLGNKYVKSETVIERQQVMRDSLLSLVEYSTTWEEKRFFYENLIDVIYNNREEYINRCLDLYYMARGEDDYECQELMLREFGNIFNIDSLNKYVDFAEELQRLQKRDMRATVCFLRVRRDQSVYLEKSKEECMDRLREIIEIHKEIALGEKEASPYDRIELLLNIVYLLNMGSAEGNFYIESMEELRILSERLPISERFIAANVYLNLANFYGSIDEPHMSLRSDSLLLQHISNLETNYKERNRHYRSYEWFYVDTYIRMLSNFEVLSDEQIADLCEKAMALEPYVEDDPDMIDLLRFYCNIATGKYLEAFEAYNKIDISQYPKSSLFASKWLSYKIFLYKELGLSSDSLVSFYDLYLSENKEYSAKRESAILAEAHIIYDVNNLRAQNDKLLLDQQEAKLNNRYYLIIFILCASVTLSLACILLFYLYMNKQKYNDKLKLERDNLIETQKQLVIAKEEAEQAERLKSAFLANMSHEIRTPLNAIIGFSHLMSTTDDKEELKEYFEIIKVNNELLLTLVNDILELSKLEAGYIEFKKQHFDMVDLLHQSAVMLRQRITTPDVEMIEDSPYKKCVINSDKKSIQQILINFATNAIKHTAKGSVTLSYAIKDGKLYLSVKDTGVGISEENRYKVFERFEKLDTFVQGTGLGLSICKAIVENVRGKIGVESKEGEGSTFWILIPVEVVELES